VREKSTKAKLKDGSGSSNWANKPGRSRRKRPYDFDDAALWRPWKRMKV
jgi:hypothetical protein